jgi:hypothetical protein
VPFVHAHTPAAGSGHVEHLGEVVRYMYTCIVPFAVWRVCAIALSFVSGWRAFSSVSLCKYMYCIRHLYVQVPGQCMATCVCNTSALQQLVPCIASLHQHTLLKQELHWLYDRALRSAHRAFVDHLGSELRVQVQPLVTNLFANLVYMHSSNHAR